MAEESRADRFLMELVSPGRSKAEASRSPPARKASSRELPKRTTSSSSHASTATSTSATHAVPTRKASVKGSPSPPEGDQWLANQSLPPPPSSSASPRGRRKARKKPRSMVAAVERSECPMGHGLRFYTVTSRDALSQCSVCGRPCAMGAKLQGNGFTPSNYRLLLGATEVMTP